MYALLGVLAAAPMQDSGSDDGGSGGSALVGFLPIILIGVAMYFLLIRPQRKRMRDQQALTNQVGEGDEIITNGGIYGFITAVDGDVLWVDIGDADSKIEIRIHRSAVARKIDPKVEPAGGEPATATDEVEDDAADTGDADAK